MVLIPGDGAEAIRALARIEKLLQSDLSNEECAIKIGREVTKFKSKTDILTMNPGQVYPAPNKNTEPNETVAADRGTQSAPVAPAGVARRGGAPSARPEKGKEV